MRRFAMSIATAAIVGFFIAGPASADGGTVPPPVVKPYSTCTNCF